MEFSIIVDIDAPPDRVWAIMSDVERWPDWTTSVSSIKRVDDGPLAVGSKAWVRQPKLPPALWRVTAFAVNEGFTWVTGSPGVHVTGRHTVAPTGRGSRVTLSVKYRGLFGGLMARLTRTLTNRYLGLEAAGLKRRSEAALAAGAR